LYQVKQRKDIPQRIIRIATTGRTLKYMKTLFEKLKALCIYAVISRILLGLFIMVVSLNVGKWLGIGLFKLIMCLGILPYLEKFFGWFVF
jgi:membrane-associated HD superfamily phosphohydrolase